MGVTLRTDWHASRGRVVTLVDGREVGSSSQDWLFECLARHVLAKPFSERQAWIADFENRRGKYIADALRNAMMVVHDARTRAVP